MIIKTIEIPLQGLLKLLQFHCKDYQNYCNAIIVIDTL